MRRPELELLTRETVEQPERCSDYRTIREILAGDVDKFQELVITHQQGIFGMVLRQVNDTALAEELTQEIFVRSFLYLQQFRFESSFNTWLTGIAINHTNSYFSSKRYHQAQKKQKHLKFQNTTKPTRSQNERDNENY